MNHSRALFLSTIFVALFSATACDNSGTTGSGGDDGSGGATSTSDNSSSTGMGNTTTGSSMSTNSTSSGSDVCNPSDADPFCTEALSCACNAMPAGMPAEAPCPNSAGNVCEPGHNQCGCDLPMGEDYQTPDTTCKNHVKGATWQWSDGQYPSLATSEPNSNGQLTVYFHAAFQPDLPYYHGFVMSNRTLSFNLANEAMLDYCTGEFASDCKSITLSCWHPGESAPYVEQDLVWVHF